MTPTISIYFGRFFLSQFIRFAIGIVALIYIIDFIELSRRTSGIEGLSFSTVLLIVALRIPSYLQSAVPFIILIAAMSSLLTLNKRSELVITRASGLSAWQFIAPICIVAFGIGVVTIGAFNPIAAKTFDMAESEKTRWGIGGAGREAIVPFFRQKTEDDGVIIVGAISIAENGTFLARPSFSFLDADNNLLKRVDAESAILSNNVWQLNKAWTYIYGNPPLFSALATVPSTLSENYLSDALTPPETVPIYELPGRIETASRSGLSTGPYRMQLHSLLATPAMLSAMALIAATVSLRFARFGQASSAILAGITAGFLLYVTTVLIKAFGSSGIIAPVIAAWLPVMVAMFVGVTFLLYKEDG